LLLCWYRSGRVASPHPPQATRRISWPQAAHSRASSRPRYGMVRRHCDQRLSGRGRGDVCCRCWPSWPPRLLAGAGGGLGNGTVRPAPDRMSGPLHSKLGRRPASSLPDRRPRLVGDPRELCWRWTWCPVTSADRQAIRIPDTAPGNRSRSVSPSPSPTRCWHAEPTRCFSGWCASAAGPRPPDNTPPFSWNSRATSKTASATGHG
jgi:hypothetical protein